MSEAYTARETGRVLARMRLGLIREHESKHEGIRTFEQPGADGTHIQVLLGEFGVCTCEACRGNFRYQVHNGGEPPRCKHLLYARAVVDDTAYEDIKAKVPGDLIAECQNAFNKEIQRMRWAAKPKAW